MLRNENSGFEQRNGFELRCFAFLINFLSSSPFKVICLELSSLRLPPCNLFTSETRVLKTCYCRAASGYCDFLGEQIRAVAVLLALWSSDSGGEAVEAALGASVAQSRLLGEEGQSTCAGDGPEISLWHEFWEMNPCSGVC